MTNDKRRLPDADPGAKDEQVDKRISGLCFAGRGHVDACEGTPAGNRAGRHRGRIDSAAGQTDADFAGRQPGVYNPGHVQPETSNEARAEVGRRG